MPLDKSVSKEVVKPPKQAAVSTYSDARTQGHPPAPKTQVETIDHSRHGRSLGKPHK